MVAKSIPWNPVFEMGIVEMDDDHRGLVRMINTFLEVVDNDEGLIAMDEIFRGLIDYTLYHFDREERMMAEAGFGGLEGHHLAHLSLKNRVGILRDLYLSRPGCEAEAEIHRFLSDWLTNHIMKMDMQYRDAILASRGLLLKSA
ncbi:MAG: hemerythrin family protein [Alphaproteobacteria bacterium]|nr:hemerythrin family protein [Alphaproteobacteria bacterium]MBF0392258.1 hemerythrin family protein [Alphaproteobacteria bacterium]